MHISSEDIRRTMREHTDEELWAILAHGRGYTREAMKIAREEGRRRGWGEGPIHKQTPALVTSQAEAPTVAAVHEMKGIDNDKHGCVGTVLGGMLLIGMIVGGFSDLRDKLNKQGWIPHSNATPVLIKGEWLVGEERMCAVPVFKNQRLPESAHLLCPPGDRSVDAFQYAYDSFPQQEWAAYFTGNWPYLDGHFHTLPVTYWGRIDRMDKADSYVYEWRCVRQEDSVKCWAVD